jgi:hypothetical protein
VSAHASDWRLIPIVQISPGALLSTERAVPSV